MSPERPGDAARRYHDVTKHSYTSVRGGGGTGLDFSVKPLPYKIYTTLESIPLPEPSRRAGMPALDAIASPGVPPERQRVPDLQALTDVMHYAAGITKRLRRGEGQMPFRAASATGALYHIELYAVCGDLPDLAAGVYHYSVHDHALRRVRDGDQRAYVVAASAAEPRVADAPVVLVATSTFWRNAWKYRARAYRHTFWDSGTILANLLAAATSRDLPAHVVLGFDDDRINHLVGADGRHEAAVELVALGSGTPVEPRHTDLPAIDYPTEPLSKREFEYEPVREAHTASSLETDDVAAWRGAVAGHRQMPGPSGTLFPLATPPDDELPRDSVDAVVRRRGSTREFALAPVSFAQLSVVLDRSTGAIPGDVFDPAAPMNDLYLIINAVEDLPPGAYLYHRDRRALELLREGEFRKEAGVLGLEQALPATAAADVFFLSDLDALFSRLGDRGYRAAQLEAAIAGGRMYLVAYAQRIGATGLTFYDDETTHFFSPHAAGKSVMFMVALGIPAYKR
jgi:SagB-type dehydrogenase family enzyme